MKKIVYFLLLCLSVLGFIGGAGYLFFIGEHVVGAGIIALGCLAFPEIKNLFKKLSQ